MLCKKCNRELLERYDGRMFCYKCGEDVYQQELMITAEGEDAFRLSEIAYLRYISPLNGILKVDNQRALFDDAVRICSSAASAGHPKAIFRMGYYYEFYQLDEKSEIERFYRSFEYYWRLCNPNTTNDYFSLLRDGVKSTSIRNEREWPQLREQAAKHILDLFELSPQTFADTRYRQAKASILKEFSHLGTRSNDRADKLSRVTEIYRVLSSCFSKKRPPLFGLFKMTGAELRELLAIEADEKSGRNHSMRVMAEKLMFHYLRCNADGSLHASQHAFESIRSGEFPEEIEDGHFLYFIFFNRNGEHTHISGRTLHRMRDEIFEDQAALFEFIGKSSRRDLLLFHEDAVYMRHVLRGNFTDLIENVCKEG